jgi:regulator of sigma E protease
MVRELAANCNTPVTLGVERSSARGIENLDIVLTPRPSGELACALGVLIGQEIGVQIATVKPGSLGEQAGLEPGDALARFGDFSMIPADAQSLFELNDEQDLAKFVTDNSKIRTTLIATYIRSGEARQVKITLPADLPAEQADLGLGFHLNPVQAVQISAERMYTAMSLLPRTLQRAFASSLAGENSGLIGPVGMTQVLQQTIPSAGFLAIVGLLIDLSLSLAIFNLFPIPGLDGGRLIFVLAEMVTRGRRLNPRTEGMIHLAGFAVLLVLVLFVFYSDITRVISGRTPFGP